MNRTGQVALFLVLGFIFTMSAGAQLADSGYRSDQILILPKHKTSRTALENFHATRKCAVLHTFESLGRMQVLRVPAGETVQSLIAKYQTSGLVEFAEPDYAIHAAAIPNDPKFADGTLWWLNNTGQSGGTPGADIHATNGWDVLNSASNIIVAIADTGIRSTHQDLAANMWINPNDGGHGFNAFTGTNNPEDDGGHGTLVAGTLGGVGNNGAGVTGVAWRVQMMACKCLDSSGNGSDSTLIACIDYARTNGAQIINASLDSTNYSQALSNAIFNACSAGIIFVASAGNASANIDLKPSYPSCYKIDNLVSVAYTTRNDTLGGLSNFGAVNVALAAPGDQMYSTFPSSDTGYYPPFSSFNIAGTSFAAPIVSGACALLLTQYPADTPSQIISRLLSSVDVVPALAGKCRTGGRVNLRKALRTIQVAANPGTANNQPFQLLVDGGLNRTCVVEASTDLVHWSPVFTNMSTANGTFVFTNAAASNISQQFFRATGDQ